ncbi:MAG TPA: glycosyltransferase [Actinomycetota bacterium]|nr:glycosyltransferase [Actinomycetota bacterium]
MTIEEVAVGSLAPEKFRTVMGDGDGSDFLRRVEAAAADLRGRCVWNVNSTARGGGVAEMLRPLLAYTRGAGVDARWIVLGGNPEFFHVTKRLHNHLHGAPGDGGPLGDEERAIYDEVQEDNARELVELVRPGDIVIVHDPQPAGLCAHLKEAGATVVWRCHIGIDQPNDITTGAWNFLRPYVSVADALVFSRRAFVWDQLDAEKVWIIAPSIDAFSAKNQALDEQAVYAILDAAGIIGREVDQPPLFLREDGTPARVDRRAEIVEDGPVPPDVPTVVQISRWDRLKDPLGVITGFATHVAPRSDAHLIYAGPAVDAVADDPEGAVVLEEARSVWADLPAEARARVHLVHLPMEDGEENAAIVNALQRYATIVVQKSIAEGFGLTVAEAMWKARPVVATKVGGIQDQIVDGESGVLIDDPSDLATYGNAVTRLLAEPDEAARLGAAARQRVRENFLGSRHLLQYIDLIERLIR